MQSSSLLTPESFTSSAGPKAHSPAQFTWQYVVIIMNDDTRLTVKKQCIFAVRNGGTLPPPPAMFRSTTPSLALETRAPGVVPSAQAAKRKETLFQIKKLLCEHSSFC